MNKIIYDSILNSVEQLIENSSSKSKLSSIVLKHKAKVHFMPMQYRVLAGILQSMNIQFGNFLETTIKNIVATNADNKIINKYSGKKNNSFRITKEAFALIDNYITECQLMPFNEKESIHKFNVLLNDIVEAEQDTAKSEKISHDVDLLFYQNSTKQYVYAEIKYNDDHDTGKFVDINRKFLLSYALIVNELNIKKTNQLKPIIMYFNNKRMKGNIYVPEQTNFFRGERFFNEFTTIPYSEIDMVFSNISENQEIIKKFNELCERILNSKY